MIAPAFNPYSIGILMFAVLFCCYQQGHGQSDPVTSSKPKETFFKDRRDGKTYRIIQIGNQAWMAENLAYKTKEGSWAYMDNIQNISQHGYLYNFETAKQVCPDGWELPTKADFEQLLFLIARDNKRPSKEIILGGCSGFDALQSGWRSDLGEYFDLGKNGNYWSRSRSFSGRAWLLYIGNNGRKSYMDFAPYQCGMSVRCIKK